MKNLGLMIAEYGTLNSDLNNLKRNVDTLNKEIKAEMKERELTSYETNGWTATYQIRKSESIDEDKLIDVLTKANVADGIVKYKPYVDEAALESAIYNNKLSQDILIELNQCKIVKETIALVVKRRA